MDKRVVFSVAGSGKTTTLVERLNLDQRFMLVTYTENNLNNLKLKIINKFGYLPQTITVCTYFTFIHSFCFKPFLYMNLRTKGIDFDAPPQWTLKLPRNNNKFYINSQGRLYHNRIAKLLEVKDVINDIKKRLEKYFDALLIDEVQDFGGHDFNFLINICSSNINLLFVGDFYQHTYVTSQDGQTNVNLHTNFESYKQRFINAGLVVDTTSLSKSYRCSKSVCDFIRNQIGIEIYSHHEYSTDVRFLSDEAEAKKLFACESTVKLFYQKHHIYACYSNNWGNSKGIDNYKDVYIVLNESMSKALTVGKVKAENSQTKNKLYVACSRARGHLYLVNQSTFKKIQ